MLLETDASNQAMAGVLSQLHPADPEDPTSKPEWKLVDCHVTTLKESQRNWPIHDKELWGIVSLILHWHSWLAGLPQPFVVHTDHQGLQYFQTKQRLNSRQASWAEKLSEFDFTIQYKPEKDMGKPDALSC